MKENDILKAMNRIDKRFVSEYAELEPKKKTTLKRIVRTGVIIAAAAALAIPAGAYAYKQLIHRESVEMYLEDADKVEASGNIENQVMENEHIRITLDTVLSDGYTALAIVTLDALDDYGKNYILTHPDIMLRRTDTGEAMFPSGSGGMDDWLEQRENSSITYYHSIDLMKIDPSYDYEMIFYSYGVFTEEEHQEANGKSFQIDENYIPVDNPLGYDFIAKVNFAKNVDTVTLTGENGKALILSQFELISEGDDIDLIDVDHKTFRLIRNDGTLEERSEFCGYGVEADEDHDKTFSTMSFKKFIDLDEYKGIMLDGVEYLKE
ncbi:MAG: hypothetical protein IJM87_01280 [Ruminococcus sp.]|nr:hypothetical protein [Ruminococcus sp.]